MICKCGKEFNHKNFELVWHDPRPPQYQYVCSAECQNDVAMRNCKEVYANARRLRRNELIRS